MRPTQPTPRERHRAVLAAVLAASAALAGSIASAQPVPVAAAQPAAPVTPAAATPVADPNAETARRYFEAGVAAMQRQDWAEAVNGFENSERLRHTASVSLNLGIARHRLGRLLGARASLNDFLQNATPAQHAQHDAEVGRLIAEIGRRVGRIQLTDLRPSSATVTVDGRPAVFNDAHELAVDPGEHRLRAEAEGFVTREETVSVAESATRSVPVVLVRVGVVPTGEGGPRGTPSPPPPSRSILTRWWFWTGVGVVAAGVVTGVVLASGTDTIIRIAPPRSSTGTVLQGIEIGGTSW